MAPTPGEHLGDSSDNPGSMLVFDAVLFTLLLFWGLLQSETWSNPHSSDVAVNLAFCAKAELSGM